LLLVILVLISRGRRARKETVLQQMTRAKRGSA